MITNYHHSFLKTLQIAMAHCEDIHFQFFQLTEPEAQIKDIYFAFTFNN